MAARVPYVTQDSLPEADRDLIDRPIHLFQAVGNRPDALRGMRAVGRWYRSASAVDPRLRELSILGVGVLTQCAYEYSHHLKLGLGDFGVSDRDVEDLHRFLAGEPTSFASVDLTVLTATREITEELAVSPAVWADLLAALGQPATIDLIVGTSYYSMVARVIGSLGIEVEPEYQSYLDAHPLRPYPAGRR